MLEAGSLINDDLHRILMVDTIFSILLDSYIWHQIDLTKITIYFYLV